MVLHYKAEYYWKLYIPPKEFPQEWKGIEDKYHRFEYTFDDVNKKVDELKANMHWGSWDFVSER